MAQSPREAVCGLGAQGPAAVGGAVGDWRCRRPRRGFRPAGGGGRRGRPRSSLPAACGNWARCGWNGPGRLRSGGCARTLLRAGHPRGPGRAPGCRMQYLLASRLGPVGVLSFVAAPLRLGPRDRYLGWDDRTRGARIGAVVSNDRFLILEGVRVPQLASHVLAQARRRLGADWEQEHGVRPVLMETCVEASRPGTSYRAAGWACVGQTDRPAAGIRPGGGPQVGVAARLAGRLEGAVADRAGPCSGRVPGPGTGTRMPAGPRASSRARTCPTGGCGSGWRAWGRPGSSVRASRCRRSSRAGPSSRRPTVSSTMARWRGRTSCNRTGKRCWSVAGCTGPCCWCRTRRR